MVCRTVARFRSDPAVSHLPHADDPPQGDARELGTVGSSAGQEGPRMNPDDMILISVDDHIAEPADMFEGHVPEKYKDKAPRVVTDENGIQQWWYGDIKGRNLGLNAVAGKPPEMYNVDASRYDQMRPGCYDVHERLRDMNAGGQPAGLNVPNRA